MQIDTYIILFIIGLSSMVLNIEITSTKDNLKNRIFFGMIQKETCSGIKVVDCLLYKASAIKSSRLAGLVKPFSFESCFLKHFYLITGFQRIDANPQRKTSENRTVLLLLLIYINKIEQSFTFY